MYHSFVLLLRCHVDDKNLDPLCRNRTTALRLNKQVFTPISTPGLVGLESASNRNSGSDSRKEPACVSGGHRGIIILTQLLLRKKKKKQAAGHPEPWPQVFYRGVNDSAQHSHEARGLLTP